MRPSSPPSPFLLLSPSLWRGASRAVVESASDRVSVKNEFFYSNDGFGRRKCHCDFNRNAVI